MCFTARGCSDLLNTARPVEQDCRVRNIGGHCQQSVQVTCATEPPRRCCWPAVGLVQGCSIHRAVCAVQELVTRAAATSFQPGSPPPPPPSPPSSLPPCVGGRVRAVERSGQARPRAPTRRPRRPAPVTGPRSEINLSHSPSVMTSGTIAKPCASETSVMAGGVCMEFRSIRAFAHLAWRER